MYCSKCQTEISLNARFCATCGNPVKDKAEDRKPKLRTTKNLQCPNCKGYKVVVPFSLGSVFWGFVFLLGVIVLIFGALTQTAIVAIVGAVISVACWLLSDSTIRKVECSICGFRWEVE